MKLDMNDARQNYVGTRTGMPALAICAFFFWLCLAGNMQSQERPFKSAPEVTSKTPELELVLNVRYAENKMFNPVSSNPDRLDTVVLRSYNGHLVGPTLRVKPGDTLKVTIENQLPKDDPSCPADHNIPQCFNTTNLHTHGFEVSPNDNSDNVFVKIKPQSNFPFEFKIPADHPAGTFWYHSHLHGSTALQVSSGMAGALIIDGARPASEKDKNGIADIDTILKQPDGARLPERIWVFQQIAYACKDNKGKYALKNPCKNPDKGMIEQYSRIFGESDWQNAGRLSAVNGVVLPVLHMKTGQIERWRMIHAGVRETLAVRIVRCDALRQALRTGFANAGDLVESLNLNEDLVKQWEFATDGLTRSSFVAKGTNVLQPGYRSDVLAFFMHEGTYCVVDQEESTGTVNAVPEQRKLLAQVIVDGKEIDEDPAKYLTGQLLRANPDLPQPVKDDLAQLKIATFAPYTDLDRATGEQQLAKFNIDDNSINGRPYEPQHVEYKLKLGNVDEWTLTSTEEGGNHPFHIHVNPFQIKQIIRPDGTPFTDDPVSCSDVSDKNRDSEYCNQIGVFRDTIFVKQGYKIIVRSHYKRFTGMFVLHCHILDHEDRGMMQNVCIRKPEDPDSECVVPSGGH